MGVIPKVLISTRAAGTSNPNGVGAVSIAEQAMTVLPLKRCYRSPGS